MEVIRARVGVENRAQHPPHPTSNSSGKKSRITTSSPPPHILGQLVEMGFSANQAKKALSLTTNGMDVQATLESLLGMGDSGSVPESHGTDAGGIGEEREERGQAAPLPAPPPPQRPERARTRGT
ncbi:hypothetical protein CVT25_008122 [Psilocybe cyanescens]|uniref:UBA domain-containing protein n=1 Tax=Psilocybe cyanescens TaxID=93625 RepID=A0A409X9I3_PSICY|nr:hypothetical protein CVT25_008122 [Psilocybe cyanescens]